MTRRTANLDLAPLPDDAAFLRAVRDAEAEQRYRDGASAQTIAWRLGVAGARRLGRGAVAHSWTGYMAPALRVAPRLRSLSKRGLLWEVYDRNKHRRYYGLTDAGREAIR